MCGCLSVSVSMCVYRPVHVCIHIHTYIYIDADRYTAGLLAICDNSNVHTINI